MLKADRNLTQWVFNYKAGAAATMGGLVSSTTSASGVGANGPGTASYVANPSGAFVLGVLLDDVEVLDPKLDRNPFREVVGVGDQVSIGSEGWVVTDMVYPGVSPTAGQAAFLGQSGYFTNVQTPAQAPKVGRFETSKDEDGFVKVSLNIPL
jgi:hypothetical protein